MTEPYLWYVLHVRAGAEHRAADGLNRAFTRMNADGYSLQAFCPETERYYRNKKTQGDKYIKRPMFPGYMFVETDMPAAVFTRMFAEYIYASEDIIRLLRNGDSDDIALRAEERIRLEYLLKGKRCMDRSIGYIEGDKITVTGGPLVGMEGNILKINRHNRTAEIGINMFDGEYSVKVALEIIDKR